DQGTLAADLAGLWLDTDRSQATPGPAPEAQQGVRVGRVREGAPGAVPRPAERLLPPSQPVVRGRDGEA
ncbi:unnamed protein product, partial [Prorocentrum cordatum]